MAQIRSKQIKDFLSTVDWATVAQNEIANAADVKTYVDTEVSALGLDADASIDSLELALSAEIVATNSDVTELGAAINSEATRAGGIETGLRTDVDSAQADIDAILLAADADKDTFAEVVTFINAVDLENDNALAAVISNLNAEIASTNSDVTRLEGADSTEKLRAETAEGVLSTDLAAELVARANGDSANATAISNEESRAIAAELSLTTRLGLEEAALSTEIAATNSDVTSIDTRLGEVSGDLVDEVSDLRVELEAEISDTNSDVSRIDAALSAEISATNSDFLSVEAAYAAADSLEVIARDAAILVEKNRAIAAEGVNATAISDEAATRLANDNTLQANIDAENARIDAILNAVGADPDSFADVVTLINSVDLENDNALAVVIGDLQDEINATNSDFVVVNASIDSLEGAIAGEFTSIDTRVSEVEAELAAEISDEVIARDSAILVEKLRAESAELVLTNDLTSEAATARAAEQANAAAIVTEKDRAEAAELVLTNALAAEIADTNSDVSRIDAKDAAQDGRLDVLESTIIEDNEMAVESFVGAGFVYTVANAVQDDNKFLVSAFVNGHKVEVSVVAGVQITLADPNYVIDANDSVVITYQF